MRFAHVLAFVSAVSSQINQIQAKAVFAHLIVGNTYDTTYDNWVEDIQKAKDAHIDGFALNIGRSDTYTGRSLDNAYKAANAVGGFSMFLSFDYASQGPWPANEVIASITKYSNEPSQYRYNGQPLVSTFEGYNNKDDWASIKQATGCFFVPSWTSGQSSFPLDKVDGHFSWDVWPHGPEHKTTSNDEAWKAILKGKPYMMGISPWFYTNVPEWTKNWLFRGDDLWYDRWQQIIEFQPEMVEILTWNDYGESNYIGPLRPGMPGTPEGAKRYVDGMPHDHWRDLLPYYIDAYKSGNTTMPKIDEEKITFWYRVNPSQSGSTGGTAGRAPFQQELPNYAPTVVSEDKIFVSVLVSSPADVTVQIGANQATSLQAKTSGVNHFSVPFNGQTGEVSFAISRNGQSVVKAAGPAITGACKDGLVNWNAYVGGSD